MRRSGAALLDSELYELCLRADAAAEYFSQARARLSIAREARGARARPGE